MARKCQLARERKRATLISRHAERRAALKKTISDPDTSPDDRREAIFKLSGMPRDGAATRYSRRCMRTGCSRAVYRKFHLNRISFRELALEGALPGVTKASW